MRYEATVATNNEKIIATGSDNRLIDAMENTMWAATRKRPQSSSRTRETWSVQVYDTTTQQTIRLWWNHACGLGIHCNGGEAVAVTIFRALVADPDAIANEKTWQQIFDGFVGIER